MITVVVEQYGGTATVRVARHNGGGVVETPAHVHMLLPLEWLSSGWREREETIRLERGRLI